MKPNKVNDNKTTGQVRIEFKKNFVHQEKLFKTFKIIDKNFQN